MKWIAGVFCLFLIPSASAQHQRQPVDASANATAPWVDMVPAPAQPASTARPSEPPQPVSVHDLLIPPKALKEIQRSQKAFESGDIRASSDHLQKALRIYADIPQAHYDLGGNYLRLREYEKALSELQQFVDSLPDRAEGHYGVSVALYLLHRYPQAEASARRAMQLDPDPVEYRYMVGNAMIAQGRCSSETKELLRQSEAKFPNASLVLAQILLNEGKIDDVVAKLQVYLRSPDTANKANAECWVALLNGTASGACAAEKTFPDFR
jgi:tetratricopeptide (TPR) repeat protein